jgi:hypothetical protein
LHEQHELGRREAWKKRPEAFRLTCWS